MASRKAKENRLPSLNDEDFQPAKKKKLSLTRFASPLKDEAMSNVAKGPTVANTKKAPIGLFVCSVNGADNETLPNLRNALQICLSRLLPSR